MEWDFVAHYSPTGEGEEATEGDVVSALEYDPTGAYLAIGDRGGRVTILARPADPQAPSEAEHVARFQSHEVEFDYLKSVEIEEKINKVRWLPRRSGASLFLTTNDKTAKLWKVGATTAASFDAAARDRSRAAARKGAAPRHAAAPPPQQQGGDPFSGTDPAELVASCRRVYGGVHQYNVNALSASIDGEAFMSGDDLRLELWHIEHGESMNVVDIKPPAMEDLSEVLTAAHFHPSHCSQFLFSTSKGQVRIGDLRDGCQTQRGRYSCVFKAEEPEGTNAFFREILTSISDACWCADGGLVLSRDYLTVKLWDPRQPARALRQLAVHDSVRPHLAELYDNDCIFDKFETAAGPSAAFCVTGSYRNQFRVYDLRSATAAPSPAGKSARRSGRADSIPVRVLDAAAAPRRCEREAEPDGKKGKTPGDRWRGLRNRLRRRGDSKGGGSRSPSPGSPQGSPRGRAADDADGGGGDDGKFDGNDWAARVLHVAAHPHRPEVVVSTLNHLYIFSSPDG